MVITLFGAGAFAEEMRVTSENFLRDMEGYLTVLAREVVATASRQIFSLMQDPNNFSITQVMGWKQKWKVNK